MCTDCIGFHLKFVGLFTCSNLPSFICVWRLFSFKQLGSISKQGGGGGGSIAKVYTSMSYHGNGGLKSIPPSHRVTQEVAPPGSGPTSAAP